MKFMRKEECERETYICTYTTHIYTHTHDRSQKYRWDMSTIVIVRVKCLLDFLYTETLSLGPVVNVSEVNIDSAVRQLVSSPFPP